MEGQRGLRVNIVCNPKICESPLEKLVDHYSELSRMMAAAGLGMSPAEAHGVASGILLAQVEDPHRCWRSFLAETMTGDEAVVADCDHALDELFATAARDLDAGVLEWQLLIPQDAAALSARCAALRDWCSGFLFGLGTAGERLAEVQRAAEAREALADLSEITRLELDHADPSETDESDFAQLTEFVRVAASLVGEEIRCLEQP